MRHRILFWLTGATLSLGFVSCGGGGGKGGKYQIAVIPKGTNHAFWKAAHAGAAKAAQETGAEIIWKGPRVESDREAQIKMVENFVTQQVDAIALAPLDDQGLVRPVRDAHKDGIKVVIWDSGLAAAADPYIDSFIATQNFEAGRQCGEKLAELLGDKKKVLLLRHMVGSASTMKREAGFLEGLKAAAPDVNLISDDQYAGATVEEAIQVATHLLNQYGKEVEGIFCPNESSTEGMIKALETEGLQGKVKFVGFDNNEVLVAALEAGTVHALAIQNPFRMGYLSVKTAVTLLEGGEVEKLVDTGVSLLTKENLPEPAMQELIHPEIEKWLK